MQHLIQMRSSPHFSHEGPAFNSPIAARMVSGQVQAVLSVTVNPPATPRPRRLLPLSCSTGIGASVLLDPKRAGEDGKAHGVKPCCDSVTYHLPQRWYVRIRRKCQTLVVRPNSFAGSGSKPVWELHESSLVLEDPPRVEIYALRFVGKLWLDTSLAPKSNLDSGSGSREMGVHHFGQLRGLYRTRMAPG